MDYRCPYCEKSLRSKVSWPKEVDGREISTCQFCSGALIVNRAWGYRFSAKILLMIALLPFLQVLLSEQWTSGAWIIVGIISLGSGLIWYRVVLRYRDYRVYEKNERFGCRR
jgi:hypothetical protein